MRTTGRTTLADVARKAGVHKMAVSVVLNGSRSNTGVSEATRQRIKDAAEELNYHPNAVARGLQQGCMNTIGIVYVAPTINFTDYYYGPIMEAIAEVALDRRQFTLFFLGRGWKDAQQSVPLYCDGRCDGLLVIAPEENSELVPTLIKARLPFVLLGDQDDDPHVSSVDVDNLAASTALVNYLLDQGHRRIAFLGWSSYTTHSLRLRLAGYRQALESRGIPYSEELVRMGDFTEASVRERTQSLLQLPAERRPTAFFAIYDEAAIYVMGAAQEMGFRVPEDVSVVGFDDAPRASTVFPPLTTIRQYPHEVGKYAAELLLDQIHKGAEPGKKILLPFELMVRGTVAPVF